VFAIVFYLLYLTQRQFRQSRPGILEAIWGESNNLWPNAYYYFNPSTFRQSFGGDNVLQEAGSLIKNFVFNQIIPWED
jgi:hypothetical protein